MNKHINRTYPHLSGLSGVNDANKMLDIKPIKESDMSETEIIEGNKLIAEFMRTPVKLYKEDEPTYIENGEQQYASFDSEFAVICNKPYEAKELLYSKSWDWLMPVIRKTRDYLQNMKRPSKNHCCKGDLIEVDLQCRLWEIDIENTWKHVVELILWINEYEKVKHEHAARQTPTKPIIGNG